MEEQPTKADLLDKLERETLLVAGEVVMHKIGYAPNFAMIEDHLGEIITAILDLKQREGVSSNLKRGEP